MTKRVKKLQKTVNVCNKLTIVMEKQAVHGIEFRLWNLEWKWMTVSLKLYNALSYKTL